MILFRRLPIRYIRGFTERKQEQELKKQKEQFKIMIEELSKKDSYTLKDFKKEIFSQDKKERGFLRRMFNEAQPEEIQLEKQKKILNALQEEELHSSKGLAGQAKTEVAQVSQTTVQDINELLRSFKFQFKLHQYLKARREGGEYIPQTREELETMLKTDRPPSNREEIFDQKKKYSVHQRKWIYSSKF